MKITVKSLGNSRIMQGFAALSLRPIICPMAAPPSLLSPLISWHLLSNLRSYLVTAPLQSPVLSPDRSSPASGLISWQLLSNLRSFPPDSSSTISGLFLLTAPLQSPVLSPDSSSPISGLISWQLLSSLFTAHLLFPLLSHVLAAFFLSDVRSSYICSLLLSCFVTAPLCRHSADNFSVISDSLLLFSNNSSILILVLHAEISYILLSSFLKLLSSSWQLLLCLQIAPLQSLDSSLLTSSLYISHQSYSHLFWQLLSYLLTANLLFPDRSSSPASFFNLLTAPLLPVLTAASLQPNTAKFLFHHHVNSFSLPVICQLLSGNWQLLLSILKLIARN